MTSLDDRVTRLENAFVDLVSLVRDLTEGQNRLEETQNRMLGTLAQVVQTQNRMLETLQEHSDILRGVVHTLQEHSADLTIIKSYLETQG